MEETRPGYRPFDSIPWTQLLLPDSAYDNTFLNWAFSVGTPIEVGQEPKNVTNNLLTKLASNASVDDESTGRKKRPAPGNNNVILHTFSPLDLRDNPTLESKLRGVETIMNEAVQRWGIPLSFTFDTNSPSFISVLRSPPGQHHFFFDFEEQQERIVGLPTSEDEAMVKDIRLAASGESVTVHELLGGLFEALTGISPKNNKLLIDDPVLDGTVRENKKRCRFFGALQPNPDAVA